MKWKSWMWVALAALCLAVVPRARADSGLVVLGLSSVEGDDEFARELSGALRRAVPQVTGWDVSDRAISLSQMALAHGCGTEPDASCLTDIALALDASRLMYGSIRRTSADEEAYDYSVNLSLFDGQARRIEHTVTATVQRGDASDLASHATGMVRQLLGKQGGTLAVRSNVASAEVRLDGAIVGQTRDGLLVLSNVAAGVHEVEVSAPDQELFSAQVVVREGEQAQVRAELTGAQAAPPRSDSLGITADLDLSHHEREADGPDVNWWGVGLLGGSAVLLGATAYSWIELSRINGDTDFDDYRERVGVMNPDSSDVCEDALNGESYADPGSQADRRFSDVQSMCRKANVLEVLQYVFLGTGIVAGAAGAWLLIANPTGSSGEHADADGTRLRIKPKISWTSAALEASLRF